MSGSDWPSGLTVEIASVLRLFWDFILRAHQAGFRFKRPPRFLGCFRIHERQKTSAMRQVGGQNGAARPLDTTLSAAQFVAGPVLQNFGNRSGTSHLLHAPMADTSSIAITTTQIFCIEATPALADPSTPPPVWGLARFCHGQGWR